MEEIIKKNDKKEAPEAGNPVLQVLNAIKALLERIAENFPERTSTRFFTAGTDTVTAGTSLTVTFSISWRNWKLKLTELYCDSRTDCTYTWYFAGQEFDLNEVTFDWGMKAVEDTYHEIVLVVANAGASDQEVGYYVKGFATYKE